MKQEPCDICGEKMTKNQWRIYSEYFDDDSPCYCNLIKKIENLEKQLIRK